MPLGDYELAVYSQQLVYKLKRSEESYWLEV